jgi:uncharacterized protein
MLFAVLFEDRQELAEVRRKFLAEHLEWLDFHRQTVLVGGSLRQELNQNPKGGLWIVDSSDKDTLLQLIESDPFTREGLRKSYEIFHWSKVFDDRKVLV